MTAEQTAERVEKKLRGLNGPKPPRPDFTALTYTLNQWAAREVPLKTFLLGNVFSTTTRAMLSANTGVGKTNLAFAIGFAMATGSDFCHWRGPSDPARVLIIDGEMSIELMQERLADAERRAGCRPPALFAICKEDAESMPPLDTPEGQHWVDDFIAHLGGVDFVILDNAMSLTVGDLKDEEAWKPVATWMRTLTKRRIGNLWINHTGHDPSRSYGTKTREWQLDVVMIAEAIEDASVDIAMRLRFTKARQRKPDNRAEFEPVTLKLVDDQWQSSEAASALKASNLNARQTNAMRAINDYFAQCDDDEMSLSTFRAVMLKADVIDEDTSPARLTDLRNQLKARGLIGAVGGKQGRIWLPSRHRA